MSRQPYLCPNPFTMDRPVRLSASCHISLVFDTELFLCARNTVHIPFGQGYLSSAGTPGRKLPVLDCEVVGKSILTTVRWAFKLRTCTQAAVTNESGNKREITTDDERFCGRTYWGALHIVQRGPDRDTTSSNQQIDVMSPLTTSAESDGRHCNK